MPLTLQQIEIVAVLGIVFALFMWGRWRYDIVALTGLFAAVILGIVPGSAAFSGFGHPATVTVVAVLVLSRALTLSGAIDLIARLVTPLLQRQSLHIVGLSGIGAVLSSVMNNVGALALLLPVAIRSAAKASRSPSLLLMPLSFGSILGGLITLIGTPPNIIVSAYREQALGDGYAMFDFAPVGGALALAGVAFITLIGWRLVPIRKEATDSATESYGLEDYIAEARVKSDSPAVGKAIWELDKLIGDTDAKIIGLIREDRRVPAVPRFVKLDADDLLIIEAGTEHLERFIDKLGLEVVDPGAPMTPLLASDDVEVVEAVISPGSILENRTVLAARFQRRHGVNLIAISRKGTAYRGRLRSFRFEAGDVILIQGETERLPDVLTALGCLPLRQRGIQPLDRDRPAMLSLAVFAIAIVVAALGLLPIAVTLGTAVVAMVVLNILHIRQLYDAVDWSVIVLLGALIPLGGALEETGATQLLASTIIDYTRDVSPVVILAVIMIVTMTVSDILNNAATAVVMAPLAATIADQLEVSPDPFLMAVAVGASCAFLTPIGHQNNTIVMGPGGYRFGDYWKLGVPLEILIVALGLPLILLVWPL